MNETHKLGAIQNTKTRKQKTHNSRLALSSRVSPDVLVDVVGDDDVAMPTLTEALNNYLATKITDDLVEAVREPAQYADAHVGPLDVIGDDTLHALLFRLQQMLYESDNEDVVECAAWYIQYIYQQREDVRKPIRTCILPRMVEILKNHERDTTFSRMVTRVARTLGSMASRDAHVALVLNTEIPCPVEMLVRGMQHHFLFRGEMHSILKVWPVRNMSPEAIARLGETMIDVMADPTSEKQMGDGKLSLHLRSIMSDVRSAVTHIGEQPASEPAGLP